MDRKEFMKTCSVTCLGLTVFGALFPGCTSSKMIRVPIENTDLILPISAFKVVRKEGNSYHSYLIIENEKLQYPICVYRFEEDEYGALLMRCTHQNTELRVFGDKLQCPAHGSEFDNKGKVGNGPASKNLRTFPVRKEADQLKISLK